MRSADLLDEKQTIPQASGHGLRLLPFILAALVIAILYATHLSSCQKSALKYLDFFFLDSDMHANLLWAQNIRQQGWLDAFPYHPYVGWMQGVAPYPQWVKWWGGPQIFQQSPLYAYLFAGFGDHYFGMRLMQALLSIGTCVLLGLLAALTSGRLAGWIAFYLAAFYAPFYLYSWPFLRDGLGWFLTAAVLLTLSELTQAEWPSARAQFLSASAGVLLGLGFLAKETYLLIIPVAWFALAVFARKRRSWRVLVPVMAATVLTISPLAIRNTSVGAPLFSSSNRLAETFLQGNAGSAHPYNATIPVELGPILYQTQGRPWPMLRAAVASHRNGVWGWLGLQFRKFLSLFDPYESPDNLSFYFVEHISPLVHFGLRYWMILPLGLIGLLLGIWQKERTHIWLWLLLPIFIVNLFVGIPLSRYRQSMMIFLIPLAAYFLSQFVTGLARREFRPAFYGATAVLVAWGLILGPLARQPRAAYERRLEYLFTAAIYYRLGDVQKEKAAEGVIRQKFPGFLPALASQPGTK